MLSGWTKRRTSLTFTRMSTQGDHYGELARPLFQVVSLGLAALFFVVFTYILRGYVPAQTALWQWVFGAYTAACLTGVFYLASHMFWVVFAEFRRSGPRA